MQFPHVRKLTQHSTRIPFLAARSFFWITPVQKKKRPKAAKISILFTFYIQGSPEIPTARSRIWLVLFLVGGDILLIPSDTFIRRCLFRTHQHPIILVSPPAPLPCCSHHTSCQAIYRPSCFPRSSNGPDHLSEVIASVCKSHFYSHHRSLARPARVPSYL